MEENPNDLSARSVDLNNSSRSLNKNMRNLLQERKMLRAQLKVERERNYRLTSALTEEERRELARITEILERKNKELDEANDQLHKVRI